MKITIFWAYFLLAVITLGHALYRIPGSYRASIYWEQSHAIFDIGETLVLSDDLMAEAQKDLMNAIINDPWPMQYRREAFKPMARMLVYGAPVDQFSANLLYGISRRAGGNAPDLLTSRYVFLMMTRGDKTELDGVAGLLRARYPAMLEDLERNDT